MLSDDLAVQVHAAISEVAPIEGVSIGAANNKTTWRIDFRPEATGVQRAAAQAVLNNFVPSPPMPTITSLINAQTSGVPPLSLALKTILLRLAGGR